MNTRLFILIAIGAVGFVLFLPYITHSYAQCLVNEDWSEAPCLDTISNGRYDQNEINQWANYYQYKGTPFMEQKRAELDQAISDDTLQEWVDESIQNRNVYEYYFFSGRAPNISAYTAEFDKFMIQESSTIHDPYTDDEQYKLASSKVPIGGLGIYPEINPLVIILGIVIGLGSFLGLMVYWRKMK